MAFTQQSSTARQGSSRLIFATVYEGIPYELPASALVDTAASTRTGSSTRLTVISHAESKEDIQVGDSKSDRDVSLLKISGQSSGNSCIVPLTKYSGSVFLSDSHGSDASRSVLVQSSYNPEKVVISYDPETMSTKLWTSPNAPTYISYTTVPTLASLGVPSATWAVGLGRDATFIVVRSIDTGRDYLCIRTDGALSGVFQSAFTLATGVNPTPGLSSVCLRLAKVPPQPGEGLQSTSLHRFIHFVDICILRESPETFMGQSTDPFEPLDPYAATWTAFRIDPTSRNNLLQFAFNTTSPATSTLNDVIRTASVYFVGVPLADRRKVRVILSAESVSGESDRFGGMSGY